MDLDRACGEHSFLEEDGNVIAHVRRKPIRFGGDFIDYKDDHPSGSALGERIKKGTFRMRQIAPLPA